ncbi:MAG TPA: bifunctional diaminohydroxyphosphoribosylaminopyrimidine deaminase/5-amino-6-(5-phosphoribosylamino)uracil reductase RibD [Phycisphaerae bacterium]|nr:bifunctional diaminohydroxyphosphoribosylaminopyrimidine deaminase/5-amino-6-(5-phosphoribosylamino)uracil reductase RibD [Phycisphaerae bacterium]
MAARFSEQDAAWMQRALRLAARGRGRVEPNPMVGCVLVRKGRVIAEGYHRRYGGPHAEVDALSRAGAGARGATAYVTLEPCSHHGKTPPCADALIAAGVARVIAACGDPFPEVAGRGLARLRRAGIAVEVGLLADEARELNAPFLTRVLLGRPYVILKWAQSADGKIATRTGDSQWISGPESRRLVHRLRARMDAVIVGSRTARADDPQLTARDVPVTRVARRVVFDSQLSTPRTARLVTTARETPTLMLTTRVGGASRKRLQLERSGVEIVVCRARKGHVDVDDALQRLAALGITNVLVEGGGALLGAFIDRQLADEAWVFTAPVVIGGRGAVASCGGDGALTVAAALHAQRVVHRVLGGRDALMQLRLTTARNAQVSRRK